MILGYKALIEEINNKFSIKVCSKTIKRYWKAGLIYPPKLTGRGLEFSNCVLYNVFEAWTNTKKGYTYKLLRDGADFRATKCKIEKYAGGTQFFFENENDHIVMSISKKDLFEMIMFEMIKTGELK